MKSARWMRCLQSRQAAYIIGLGLAAKVLLFLAAAAFAAH